MWKTNDINPEAGLEWGHHVRNVTKGKSPRQIPVKKRSSWESSSSPPHNPQHQHFGSTSRDREWKPRTRSDLWSSFFFSYANLLESVVNTVSTVRAVTVEREWNRRRRSVRAPLGYYGERNFEREKVVMVSFGLGERKKTRAGRRWIFQRYWTFEISSYLNEFMMLSLVRWWSLVGRQNIGKKST